MKISISTKIFSLIMLFVLLLSAVFFKLCYGFFIEDKTNTVQEMQTLQVSKTANDYIVKMSSARTILREAAIRLLDDSRGRIDELNKDLIYLTIDGRHWSSKESNLDEQLISRINAENSLPRPEQDWFLETIKVSEKNFFKLKDTLKIRKAGVDTQVSVVGLLKEDFLLSNNTDEKEIADAVLVDIKTLMRGEKFIPQAVLTKSQESQAYISKIIASQYKEWQDRFQRTRQPTGIIQNDSSDRPLALVSWTPAYIQQDQATFVVVTAIDYELIKAGFRDFVVQLLVIAILVGGLSAFAAFGVARHFSRPIEKIVEATQVFETGDFNVRVSINQSDEIGDMGRAFNHMGETLQKREMELNAAQGALIQNEKLAALGTLSAGIAHEVKNPLAGILGNAELAESMLSQAQGANIEKVKGYIEVIKKETKRTRGIIDGLMRFSRKEKQEHEPFDLEVVLHETIALMEHSLNMNSVRIRTNFDSQLQLVKGHANSVEQVFLNMLQNAGHAMPNGGEITITTKYYPSAEAPLGVLVATTPKSFDGAFCRVEIKDTGCGMTPEVMRKIFEPFFTTKGSGVGTGLGLSVTMNILNDHKARVSLDSEPGVGTTFYMDFMVCGPRTEAVLERINEVMVRKQGGVTNTSSVNVETMDLSKAVDASSLVNAESHDSSSLDLSNMTKKINSQQTRSNPSQAGSKEPRLTLHNPIKKTENETSSFQSRDPGTVTQFAIRKPGVRK